MNFTTTLKQRRAGGIIPLTNGYKLEAQKWPHDTPICYRFEDGSDDFTMLIARKAFQFWTENSCLTWQEGCAGKPTVKVTTNGVGCFTTKGRAAGVEIRPFTSADGRTEEKVVPIFDGEQHLSLGAPGCSWVSLRVTSRGTQFRKKPLRFHRTLEEEDWNFSKKLLLTTEKCM